MNKASTPKPPQPNGLQLFAIVFVTMLAGIASAWWYFEVWAVLIFLIMLRVFYVFFNRKDPRRDLRMANLAAVTTGFIFGLILVVTLKGGAF